MQPYYYFFTKLFGVEHYTHSGTEVTWDYLLEFYEEHGYWYGAVSIRLQAWYLISISVSYMSIFFSLSTVLDLYLVLKNPFASSDKRLKKAITASIISAILLAWIGLIFTRSKIYWLS